MMSACSEDAIVLIEKVTYNAADNKYRGFPILLEHGISSSRQFQTDSFNELKSWCENNDKTHYLNIRMVKPLIASNPLMFLIDELLDTCL